MIKRRGLLYSLILGLLIFLFNGTNVYAAKKFAPRVKSSGVSNVAAVSSIPSSVHYRPDHHGIFMSFLNFNGIDSVSYSFTYTTNGNSQGAGGTISAGNNPSTERELLFGTCSTGVCTYHTSLANARLVLTAKMSNGATRTKSYRIKTYF
jgi:hypothetical protein